MLSVAHTLICSRILDHSLCPSVPQCPCLSGESILTAFYESDRALNGRINEVILVTQFEDITEMFSWDHYLMGCYEGEPVNN